MNSVYAAVSGEDFKLNSPMWLCPLRSSFDMLPRLVTMAIVVMMPSEEAKLALN